MKAKIYYQSILKYRNKIRFGGNRELVLDRDGYKCVKCGMTDEEHRRKWNCSITIDHIDGKGSGSKVKNNALNNLQTLCKRCHGIKDARRKLTPKYVLEIRKMVEVGIPKIRIASCYKITEKEVTHIIKKKIWSYI